MASPSPTKTPKKQKKTPHIDPQDPTSLRQHCKTLRSILQYNCEVETIGQKHATELLGKQTGKEKGNVIGEGKGEGAIVCREVKRVFRGCPGGWNVETTAWEGETENKA